MWVKPKDKPATWITKAAEEKKNVVKYALYYNRDHLDQDLNDMDVIIENRDKHKEDGVQLFVEDGEPVALFIWNKGATEWVLGHDRMMDMLDYSPMVSTGETLVTIDQMQNLLGAKVNLRDHL